MQGSNSISVSTTILHIRDGILFTPDLYISRETPIIIIKDPEVDNAAIAYRGELFPKIATEPSRVNVYMDVKINAVRCIINVVNNILIGEYMKLIAIHDPSMDAKSPASLHWLPRAISNISGANKEHSSTG